MAPSYSQLLCRLEHTCGTRAQQEDSVGFEPTASDHLRVLRCRLYHWAISYSCSPVGVDCGGKRLEWQAEWPSTGSAHWDWGPQHGNSSRLHLRASASTPPISCSVIIMATLIVVADIQLWFNTSKSRQLHIVWNKKQFWGQLLQSNIYAIIHSVIIFYKRCRRFRWLIDESNHNDFCSRVSIFC